MTPKKTKNSEVEVARRVRELVVIRLEGALIGDVRQYAEEHGWGVSESMLYKYIAKADLQITESTKEDNAAAVRRHLAKRRFLYSRSVTTGDYRTALACLQDEAELRGLYPPKKVKADVTTRVVGIVVHAPATSDHHAGNGDDPG